MREIYVNKFLISFHLEWQYLHIAIPNEMKLKTVFALILETFTDMFSMCYSF